MALRKTRRGTSRRGTGGLRTTFFPLGISHPKRCPRVDQPTASISVGEKSNTCFAKFSEPSTRHRDCPVLCATGTEFVTDSKIRRERGIANTGISKHRYENSPEASLKLAPEGCAPKGRARKSHCAARTYAAAPEELLLKLVLTNHEDYWRRLVGAACGPKW